MELRGANIGEPRKSRVPRNTDYPPLIVEVEAPPLTLLSESQLLALTKAELVAIILGN